MKFRNRTHAGRLLAQRLTGFKSDPSTVVLALPRGGVPVAIEVARELKAPLEILAVKKIGAPFNPEFAVGAICEDGPPHFNEEVVGEMGLGPMDIAEAVVEKREQIKKQVDLFRGDRELTDLKDRTIILVDDGLATGTTAVAAIRFLKKRHPRQIILAVPVAALSSARFLRAQVDQFVAVMERSNLVSVGSWYDDFSQVENEEVVRLIAEYNRINFTNSSVAL